MIGTVEDTLFVPMLGRIYASKNFPALLNDSKALSLDAKLPSKIKEEDKQKQYTLIASASRSRNFDRVVNEFLSENKNGIVAELGCGLETTYFRNSLPCSAWYCIDLEAVIQYRRELIPEEGCMKYIAGDAFKEDWIKAIRKDYPTEPLLIIASGLFYYFEEDRILTLLKSLSSYGNIRTVFDAVNKSGMKRMRSTYMKQVGHEDAAMFFYVDKAEDLAHKIGNGAKVIREEPFYAHIPTKGLESGTRLTMKLSDMLRMVKLVELKLS